MRKLTAALALLAATSAGGAASAKLVKFGAGSVSLRATGPAGVAVRATTTDVRVADDGSVLMVIAGLERLTTGFGPLDDAIHETLEADRCPTATLRVATNALALPKQGASTAGEIAGKLRLHCTTRDIRLRYRADRDGASIDVRGSMTFDMRDFGMTPPSILGLTARPDVAVAAQFRVKEE